MRAPIGQFSIQKENGVTKLVAELSDFNDVASPFHKLYPDAADVGLEVIGGSGVGVTYYLAESKRDGDGDLQFHELLPTPESIAKVPACARTKVVLFND